MNVPLNYSLCFFSCLFFPQVIFDMRNKMNWKDVNVKRDNSCSFLRIKKCSSCIPFIDMFRFLLQLSRTTELDLRNKINMILMELTSLSKRKRHRYFLNIIWLVTSDGYTWWLKIFFPYHLSIIFTGKPSSPWPLTSTRPWPSAASKTQVCRMTRRRSCLIRSSTSEGLASLSSACSARASTPSWSLRSSRTGDWGQYGISYWCILGVSAYCPLSLPHCILPLACFM